MNENEFSGSTSPSLGGRTHLHGWYWPLWTVNQIGCSVRWINRGECYFLFVGFLRQRIIYTLSQFVQVCWKTAGRIFFSWRSRLLSTFRRNGRDNSVIWFYLVYNAIWLLFSKTKTREFYFILVWHWHFTIQSCVIKYCMFHTADRAKLFFIHECSLPHS